MALLSYRTSTWDRPPASEPQPLPQKTQPFADQALIYRTSTWDRPPLSERQPATVLVSQNYRTFSRTATLLESSRVTPAAANSRPLLLTAGSRSLSEESPTQGKRSPIAELVPPTVLRNLEQLPHSVRSAVPLQPRSAAQPSLSRLGTWSEAPAIPEVNTGSWSAIQPSLSRLGTWSEAPAAEVSTSSWSASASQAQAAQTNTSQMTTLQQVAQPGGKPSLWRAHTVTVGETKQAIVDRIRMVGPAVDTLMSGVSVASSSQKAPSALFRASTVSSDGTQPILVSGITALHTPLPRPRPVETEEQRLAKCQEVGRLLLGTALRMVEEEDARPKQLRLIVGGLMGSGKSTMCRMLRHLLGGAWVNQDEFAHLGKGAKRAFLAEIQRVAGDTSVPVLLVDKINTMKQHRTEITDCMAKGGEGNFVFIQLRHPADKLGSWAETVKLCLSRIRGRGAGHRTLMGDNPKLRGILEGAAKGFESMSGEELRMFDSVLKVDMTMSQVSAVMKLLADLDEVGLLEPPRFDVSTLRRPQTVAHALQVANQMELEMAQKAAVEGKTASKAQSPKQHSQVNGKGKKPPPLWFYTVQLDEESTFRLESFWKENGGDYEAKALNSVKEYHVTLLYLGGGSDKEVAERNPHLNGPEKVAERNPHLNGPEKVAFLREALARREGEQVEIEVPSIVWDSRVAAAEAVLRSGVDQLCANVHPHITLGTGNRVNPVASNELLARRSATRDLQAGLTEWIRQLGYQKYEQKLAAWCQSMGAASPEEIAEFSSEAAQALEPDDKASQEHIAGVLGRAASSPIREISLANPLCLTGVVTGRLRGQ
eukprot:TRINITY_DN996_c0_g1_i1.p1 TRINITY_DN996_c0_g1~~TRINITY_DN996_c0_g1_i1.p1  ORF type:complete len:823 (-),score=138.88 TRINITY_DN996_c0_g1_i1:436-2904(-)